MGSKSLIEKQVPEKPGRGMGHSLPNYILMSFAVKRNRKMGWWLGEKMRSRMSQFNTSAANF